MELHDRGAAGRGEAGEDLVRELDPLALHLLRGALAGGGERDAEARPSPGSAIRVTSPSSSRRARFRLSVLGVTPSRLPSAPSLILGVARSASRVAPWATVRPQQRTSARSEMENRRTRAMTAARIRAASGLAKGSLPAFPVLFV